jgi:hypothetical protein
VHEINTIKHIKPRVDRITHVRPGLLVWKNPGNDPRGFLFRKMPGPGTKKQLFGTGGPSC